VSKYQQNTICSKCSTSLGSSCLILPFRGKHGFNFTCTFCIICYQATQTVEIFHIPQLFPTYHNTQNFETRLSASSCPSVRPSALNNSAPTGLILMILDIWVFSKICRENSSFIYTRKEQVLYMKTFSHFWQYLAKCRENSSFIYIRKEQVLHMKTFSHFWQYLAKFYLEWEMF
jgi:hypothetical protein